MKVGTDGILLGAWTAADSPPRILDIGTGTGLIALMLALQFPAARIDAVESNHNACNQAAANFEASPWGDRLTAVHSSIQEFEAPEKYSLIVSNPPWFRDSMRPEDQARVAARHTDSHVASRIDCCSWPTTRRRRSLHDNSACYRRPGISEPHCSIGLLLPSMLRSPAVGKRSCKSDCYLNSFGSRQNHSRLTNN